MHFEERSNDRTPDCAKSGGKNLSRSHNDPSSSGCRDNENREVNPLIVIVLHGMITGKGMERMLIKRYKEN
jgi:hypothetical protein